MHDENHISEEEAQPLNYLPIHPQVPKVGSEEKNGTWLFWLVTGTADIQ